MSRSQKPPATLDDEANALANVLMYDALLAWIRDIGLPDDHQAVVETRKARADELAALERIQRES